MAQNKEQEDVGFAFEQHHKLTNLKNFKYALKK
jgi:hypothetical protein